MHGLKRIAGPQYVLLAVALLVAGCRTSGVQSLGHNSVDHSAAAAEQIVQQTHARRASGRGLIANRPEPQNRMTGADRGVIPASAHSSNRSVFTSEASAQSATIRTPDRPPAKRVRLRLPSTQQASAAPTGGSGSLHPSPGQTSSREISTIPSHSPATGAGRIRPASGTLIHPGHSISAPLATAHHYTAGGQCTTSQAGSFIPTEQSLVSTGPYIIQPPDILVIELMNPVPRPPYHVQPGDVLRIVVGGVPDSAALAGDAIVQPDGMVSLGEYGRVQAHGLTVEEIQTSIHKSVVQRFSSLQPVVQVALASSPPSQMISGQHLVRPDGTIGLGTYGSLHARGLSIDQLQEELRRHLSQYFLDPKVSVDVMAYNSSFYYVITDNGGAGEQIVRLPYTGSDTVLDAISLIGGVSTVSDKNRIWIARSQNRLDPHCQGPSQQILQVNWQQIVECGDASTNYQLMPNDRIYLDSDKVIEMDTVLAKLISPIERVLGVVLLGSTTVRSVNGDTNQRF